MNEFTDQINFEVEKDINKIYCGTCVKCLIFEYCFHPDKHSFHGPYGDTCFGDQAVIKFKYFRTRQQAVEEKLIWVNQQ